MDASAVERDLVHALSERYPSPDPDDDLSRSTAAYARAMTAVHGTHFHA